MQVSHVGAEGLLSRRAALAEARGAARDGAATAAASETEALLRDNGLLRAALAAMQGQLRDSHAAGELCHPFLRSRPNREVALHLCYAKMQSVCYVRH